MSRSTVHYADSKTNTTLKNLHNKLRPAGTPIQRVEYIIELILLRMFETKLKREDGFKELREVFKKEEHKDLLFNYLKTISSDQITEKLNKDFFPFYGDIINKVREVVKGNLSTEVSDQLSLIQQVFKGSNFTNNVQSGNLSDIISSVDELDEERLLHSDLLGDAIESALSETGGTKDMGLFRTPDHIRHFMVGLTEPSIKDVTHDPACGTGGFLFDAYDYVIARCNTQFADDESETKLNFPKFDKSHPEIKAWFENFFRKNPTDVPSEEETKLFYSQGISGIEYLGIVKKMAAVNFYIRGINPQNIEHGDSLHLFNPSRKESKSLILANPPFGAEKDQKSYANVWEDYSKESETTILFVKMMLDSLRPGGRCAVIVSEGFLTWEQNSARALRQMLLDEAILEAVIGLPQGVFISKSGQGPKTSILLFRKPLKNRSHIGEGAGAEVIATKQVWFYQVQNDGYTRGSNRNVQAGCQLVDALNLYHQYVKLGKTAPESIHFGSKNTFTLAVDWLKTIDPRIKIKIRKETREALEPQRDEAKRILEEKLIAKFEKQLKKNIPSLFDEDLPLAVKETIKEELQKLQSVWDNRIQNEIVKKIDRAYIFSFNASTYRSGLTDLQIEQFKTELNRTEHTLTGDLRDSNSLDQWYAQLLKLKEQKQFDQLANQLLRFEPQNAIEADIVREVVADITDNLPVFEVINALFKSGAKYSMVKLESYLIENKDKVKPINLPEINWRVLGVSNEIGVFLNEKLKAEETGQSYIRAKKGEFCYNPYRINVGSIGFNEYDYDNQIISGAYVVFGTNENELNPQFLNLIVKSKRFLEFVNDKANVGSGVRMNFTFDDFKTFEIPLPPLEKQIEILTKIEKLQAVVKGSEMVINNWEVEFNDNLYKQPMKTINSFTLDSMYGCSEKSEYQEAGKKILRIGNVGFCSFKLNDIKNVTLSENDYKKYKLEEGDFLIVRSNGNPNLVGKCCVWDNDFDFVFASYLIRFRFNKTINPKYIMYFLTSKDGRKLLNPKAGGGTFNISASEFLKVQIPCPDIALQDEYVREFDEKLSYLSNFKSLKSETESKINQIVNNLWSES